MSFPWKLWLRLLKEEKALEVAVDHKQKSAVVRVPLDSISKLTTGTVKLDEDVVPYLVFEVVSAPEFYKLSDGAYTDSDDWTQGQASIYSRTTILFHCSSEDLNHFIDEMLAIEENLATVAGKTPSWPVLIQDGPTLIPVTFPEDPNDIMYMTREQLEQELIAHRKKKSGVAQGTRRPGGSRKNPRNSNSGKAMSPLASPVIAPTGGGTAPADPAPFPYTIPPSGPVQQQQQQQPQQLDNRTVIPAAIPAPARGEGGQPAPQSGAASESNVTPVAPSITGVKRAAPAAVPEA